MASKKTTGTKRVTKTAKANLKPGTHDWLRANDYSACDVCGRLMKDLPAHARDHKSGVVGEDGKRTNRKPAEAAAFRFRWNGRKATEVYRGLAVEKRIALGAKRVKAKKTA
jgi:hypothetical protein